MSSGKVWDEMEVNVAATKAWELYSSLRLAMVLEQHLSHILTKIDVVEGDGGVGTVLLLTFAPGSGTFSSYKEKFTKIDDENRVKEVEVIEGGYLDEGFKMYRVRIEIIEKSESSCITKMTIEYELHPETDVAAATSLVTIQSVVSVMEVAASHLLNTTPPPN